MRVCSRDDGQVPQHAVEIAADVCLGHPNRRDAAPGQRRIAHAILPFPSALVTRPVDLDHEPKLMAVEVGDEAEEDVLTSKLQAKEPMVPKSRPEDPLALRRRPPEGTDGGSGCDSMGDVRHGINPSRSRESCERAAPLPWERGARVTSSEAAGVRDGG